MKEFRLIESGFCDAHTNMAVDKAMLSDYQEGLSPPTLRLYGWKQAAFSVGCSQKPEDVLDLDACAGCGMIYVKRPTGGGVIFHDHELTYSVVLAQSDIGLKCSVKESFEKITAFLIKAYQMLGVSATFAKYQGATNTNALNNVSLRAKRSNLLEKDCFGTSCLAMTQSRQSARNDNDYDGRCKDINDVGINSRAIADFCFSRKEEYDILVQGKKIGGNAQKRNKNVILQHGSIPFAFDKNKIRRFLKNRETLDDLDIISLHEITGDHIDFKKLSRVLIQAFGQHFGTHAKA